MFLVYIGWLCRQIALLNPLCVMLYGAASWMFFRERVYAEEATLLAFFGAQYVDYQRRVPTGLPAINGCLPDEHQD
jgi:protein-S-isoprenylcysteine O-methyltransferase